MNEIVLERIDKDGCTISYDFSVSLELRRFFSGERFVIDYPINVSDVPDAVAAVPFVCNVLPIIWLTNSTLYLPELDQDFYECIPYVKAGYEKLFPESAFLGKVVPNKVVTSEKPTNGGSAAFFSGGLDATQTLISHIDEKPHLISIWGADIRYDNKEGWDIVHQGIVETTEKFSLPDVVIRSSFREFDREGVLHHEFAPQLKDGWWHGVKHGLAILGHAAPYVYLKKLSTVYIASSNCPADGMVRCASSPYTDNYVRFAGCKVIHDGYEYSRQDKAGNVVAFCRETGNMLKLHACWESQTGSNCCRCEKCYRTMVAIIAEGGDPEKYGFDSAIETIQDMRHYLVEVNRLSKHLAEHHWFHVQKRLRTNAQLVKKGRYWNKVKWLCRTDFMKYEKVKMPVTYRIRVGLAKCRFYRLLSNLKQSLIRRLSNAKNDVSI